jgi:integrase
MPYVTTPLRRVNLTDKQVVKLKPATGTRYDVHDAQVPGLMVNVTPTGHKAFMFRTRFPGQKHAARRILGEVGAMTIEQARTKARAWLALLGEGIDPSEHERQQQEAARLAELRSRSNTFLSVAEAYFAHIRSEKRVKADIIARVVRKEFVSRWSERLIYDITQQDVAVVITDAKKRGAPSQAHTLFEYARSIWRWAIETGAYGLETSPTDKLRARSLIGSKKMRQRVLTDDELRTFWSATGTVFKPPYPWSALYQLLLLTGQRLSDVSDATWSEFDISKRLWIIPAARYKSSVPQLVPLTDEMIAILQELPRFKSGEHLFSASYGKSPVKNFAKPKMKLDAAMQVSDWVVHDIRRTVRSHLSALPVEQHVRERVIGHGPKGLQRVYDRYEYLDEKRRCLELWQTRLSGILSPTPDNITDLNKARKQRGTAQA